LIMKSRRYCWENQFRYNAPHLLMLNFL